MLRYGRCSSGIPGIVLSTTNMEVEDLAKRKRTKTLLASRSPRASTEWMPMSVEKHFVTRLQPKGSVCGKIGVCSCCTTTAPLCNARRNVCHRILDRKNSCDTFPLPPCSQDVKVHHYSNCPFPKSKTEFEETTLPFNSISCNRL